MDAARAQKNLHGLNITVELRQFGFLGIARYDEYRKKYRLHNDGVYSVEKVRHHVTHSIPYLDSSSLKLSSIDSDSSIAQFMKYCTYVVILSKETTLFRKQNIFFCCKL